MLKAAKNPLVIVGKGRESGTVELKTR